jgi:hypothetical protein
MMELLHPAITPSEIEVQTEFPLDPCFVFLIAGSCDMARVRADGIAKLPAVAVEPYVNAKGEREIWLDPRMLEKRGLTAHWPELTGLWRMKAGSWAGRRYRNFSGCGAPIQGCRSLFF